MPVAQSALVSLETLPDVEFVHDQVIVVDVVLGPTVFGLAVMVAAAATVTVTLLEVTEVPAEFLQVKYLVAVTVG
jgi:hypothetical protein